MEIRPKKSFYFFAVALLPLLFLIQNLNIAEPLHATSQAILKPFFVMGHSFVESAENINQSFKIFLKTFEDRAVYEMKIADLESMISDYHELQKENDRLRKLLDFNKDSPHDFVSARVIGRDPSPWRKTILIDKGSIEGIKSDMAVVVSEGLVGRVFEVFPSSSRVMLLVDADLRLSAITSESRSEGIVGGDGTSELFMTYLELDSGVTIDEEVMSSGLGGLFPKGLRIGKIISVLRAPNGLHLKATVKPFVNFSKLEEVLCIKK